MKDKLGQELQAGDYVAYAGRHSSTLWIKIGKIVKIERRLQNWGPGFSDVAIIWAVEERGPDRDGMIYERQLQKSQVSNNHLMIKLHTDYVPAGIIEVLDPLTIDTPNETWAQRTRRSNERRTDLLDNLYPIARGLDSLSQL